MMIVEQADPQHIFNWKNGKRDEINVIEIEHEEGKFGCFYIKNATIHVHIKTHLGSFELSDPKSIDQAVNYILRCIAYQLAKEVENADEPELSTMFVEKLFGFLTALAALVTILYAIHMFRQ